MVEKIFISIENYMEFFKEIDDIHATKNTAYETALSEIYTTYGHLLRDEKTKQPNEFLKPDIPKIKKETKEKSDTSRGCRKQTSILDGSGIKTDAKTEPDEFRRSSRIASKKNLLGKSSLLENTNENSSIECFTQTASSDYYGDNTENFVNIENMVNGLAHSTPTSPTATENAKIISISRELSAVKICSPISQDMNLEKPNSVKKRIEEFEKRAKVVNLPSKLPVKTPVKKKAQGKKTLENGSVSRFRLLRGNNILRDKNTGSRINQMQDVKKKKTFFKNNITKTKNKKDESNCKYKTTKKTQNLLKENEIIKINNGNEETSLSCKPKKYFKVTENKTLKKESVDSKVANLEAGVQKLKLIESSEINKNHNSENTQYEIDHNIENESSEDEECPKKQVPTWATRDVREYPLNVQAWLNKQDTIYLWFSNKNLKNPKLEELFSMTIKMRPRTSSAVWNTKTFFK